MKALVLGHRGSIGSRHTENLKALGVDVLGADLGEKPNWDVDFVVIATPTYTHADMIMECAGRKIPFFCEKPLGGSSFELDRIQNTLITVPNMVACNLRFSPTMEVLRKFVEQSEIVSFHARISDGNPARAKYAEGIALQDIHEFDYLSYLFGPTSEITVVSSPDKSVYDAFVLFRGVQGTVHGDKLSDTYHREITLTSKKRTLTVPILVSNQMYVDQMDYFLTCLKDGSQPMNSVSEAIDLTRQLCEEYEFAK